MAKHQEYTVSSVLFITAVEYNFLVNSPHDFKVHIKTLDPNNWVRGWRHNFGFTIGYTQVLNGRNVTVNTLVINQKLYSYTTILTCL